LESFEGHVFATADEGAGVRELAEFRPRGEGLFEGIGKMASSAACGEKPLREIVTSGGDAACDLTFDQGKVDAANAGGLSGAENFGAASALMVVDGNGAVVEIAAEQ
jgi:hypothetical protein